jgi:hypothetical protein
MCGCGFYHCAETWLVDLGQHREDEDEDEGVPLSHRAKPLIWVSVASMDA